MYHDLIPVWTLDRYQVMLHTCLDRCSMTWNLSGRVYSMTWLLSGQVSSPATPVWTGVQYDFCVYGVVLMVVSVHWLLLTPHVSFVPQNYHLISSVTLTATISSSYLVCLYVCLSVCQSSAYSAHLTHFFSSLLVSSSSVIRLSSRLKTHLFRFVNPFNRWLLIAFIG